MKILSILSLGVILVLVAWSTADAQSGSPRFSCKTDDTQLTPAMIQLMKGLTVDTSSARRPAGPRQEVFVAIDVDNELYRLFAGDVPEIKRYVYQTIEAASAVFERELNIRLTVSYFRIWDTADPYTRRDDLGLHLADMTKWWKQNLASVPRNFILGYSAKEDPQASGIAYLNGTSFSEAAVVGYHQPGVTDRIVTIIHEIGHVMGSPHTNNCNWPGGPIDFCGSVEGSCYAGPVTPRIGTVMSTCQTVGNGKQEATFNPFCVALIRKNSDVALASQTIGQAPAVPTGIAAVAAQRPDPYLEWAVTPKAERYRFQLATSSSFADGVVTDTLLSFPLVQISDVPNQTYFWRVKSINSLGESAWSATAQLTVTASPTLRPPSQRLPVANARMVRNATVNWFPAEGAAGYVVQANYSPTFTTPVYSKTLAASATGQDFAQDNFATCANCQIFWRIKSINAGTESAWSPVRSFVKAPQITSVWPAANRATAVKHQLSIPISWFETSEEASTSTVQLATSPDFTNPIFTKNLTYNQLNEPSVRTHLVVMADSLQPNKIYYVRIKVKNLSTGYESTWTNSSFQTGPDNRRWAYVNPANTALPMTGLNDLAFDASGTAYLASEQGLYRSPNGRQWTAVPTDNVPPNVAAIAVNPKNQAYLLANSSVYRQTGSTWERIPNPAGAPTLTGRLLVDGNGVVYVIASRAVYRYNGTQWAAFTQPTLPNSSIGDAALDGNNHLWLTFGPKIGLGHFDGTKWEILTTLPIETPYCVAVDRTGQNVVVGGVNGLARLNLTDQSWTRILSKEITGFDNRTFTQVRFDVKNNPVVLSSETFYWFDGQNWLTDNFLSAGTQSTTMRVGLDNRIWLLNNSHGLSQYDTRTIVPIVAKTNYCPGDAMQVTFTTNFTPSTGVKYRAELSDPTGVQFVPVVSSVESGTATVRIPASQPNGPRYKVRLVAEQDGLNIYGDESLNFIIYPIPRAGVTPGPTAAVCAGSLLTLQADADIAATLQWSKDGTAITGATTQSLTVNQAGSYAVAVLLDGCRATSPPVAVTVKEGITATITPQGPTRVYVPNTVGLVANGTTGYAYQWFRDGTAVAGATSVSFAAPQSGQYSVLVTAPNGCTALASAVPVTIDIVLAVDPSVSNLGSWSISPNPVDRTCTVTFPSGVTGPVVLTLVDATGRAVHQKTIPPGQRKADLNVSGLPPGTYLLRVTTDQTEVRQRLLKQ
ncbi:T9SS C-terminal target domain-containing protein [Fibrisoma montanum]|uniref:T9SS C-terminal target domain-containing protein n=1 Tax=Fibrisoma montanum TaxID=2305895 RepID=A0A418MHV2_9BACT|nr:M12 family metallo-peptidase [Fibrisoma montanum]RIV27007.1 T9SS C-terminal target domain-containing protein [Fibrisoma montanum]